MIEPGSGSRIWGVVRISVSRVRHRIVTRGSRQTLLSIVGVALSVGLVCTVTSVGVGLASQDTVQTANTDYWIVPAESQGSAVTDVESTKFGQVHTVTSRLEQRPNIQYVTPVLFDLIQVNRPDGTSTRVFVIGIIPRNSGEAVVGLPTDQLTSGDPYYDDGGYNGTWTGEAVLSASAATALNATVGDRLIPRAGTDTQRFCAVAIQQAREPGLAQFPVVLVHLAEAQAVTGAADADQANQFLVDASDPSAQSTVEAVYPQSEVVSRSGLLSYNLQQSELPFAMSIAATIIALIVGVSSIITTIGFEVLSDAPSRAVLAALGVSRLTRGMLIVCETVITAALGGIGGLGIGLVAITLLNTVGQSVSSVPLAVFDIRILAGSFALSILVGVVALPAVLLFADRAPLIERIPEQ